MRKIAFILFFSLCAFSGKAFNFSQKYQDAYFYTFKGSFNKSRKILIQQQKTEPNNGARHFLTGFNAFIQVVFAENDALDKAFLDSHLVLIASVERLPEHAFKKYALAELHLQHGMVALRQGSYVGGLWDLRKSYNLLEKNLQEYPEFLLSKKTLYTLQALLSNVPEKYKDLVELLGFKTDQYVALAELNTLQESLKTNKSYGFFRREVELYRAVLMHKLTEQFQEAYDIIKVNTADYKSNPISCFIRGKMALDSKKSGEAIEILKHFAGEKCPFPYINYDLGNALLYSLNAECLQYFAHFIKQNPGKGLLNDTYLRLAWWGYMKNDTEMMNRWKGFIEDPAPSNRERDKVAIKEAEILSKTHPELLKARLAFDGGYYEYALKILEKNAVSIQYNDFNNIRYHYQIARILQDMERFDKAISEFTQVTKLNFDKDEYFVPVSCFNLALIYEFNLVNKTKAIEFYTKCVGYKNYPFASSYKYKSELAIERLTKKE